MRERGMNEVFDNKWFSSPPNTTAFIEKLTRCWRSQLTVVWLSYTVQCRVVHAVT